MSESVQFFGVKPDGSIDFLGNGKETPGMKMRDLVRNYFGEPSADECGSDADMCLWALDDFYKWMMTQGYMQEPPIILDSDKA